MAYERKTARKPKSKKQKEDPEREYSTPVPGHPDWATKPVNAHDPDAARRNS